MTAAALNLARTRFKVDRVVLAIVLILLALSLIAPLQARASLGFMVTSLAGVAPFLVLSVAVAAYAKASGADNLIAHAFTGRTEIMIVLAAIMGALSPFCSCGVIPLIAALLSMGVPLPPVMAFWLASPLMDPSMFVLTLGTLGPLFAVYKTAAAIGVGLLGGFGTAALMGAGWFARPLGEGIGDGGCGGTRVRRPGPVAWRFWSEPEPRRIFARSGGANLVFLGKWLALAFVLESLMLAFVPAEAVVAVLGGDGWWPVLVATLVGVPAYLNGYAALPLVGGLIGQGMAAGAGMAFLLAGGVTSIPAAIAVFALARVPVFLAYLGFAFAGALSAGLVFNLII